MPFIHPVLWLYTRSHAELNNHDIDNLLSLHIFTTNIDASHIKKERKRNKSNILAPPCEEFNLQSYQCLHSPWADLHKWNGRTCEEDR